jgi:hypothetical protein
MDAEICHHFLWVSTSPNLPRKSNPKQGISTQKKNAGKERKNAEIKQQKEKTTTL